MSPVVINEIISLMGNTVLRKILQQIKQCSPPWYGIIIDEATDVCQREQLNLSIRWVDDNYLVHEDPIGLICLPNTTADTLL